MKNFITVYEEDDKYYLKSLGEDLREGWSLTPSLLFSLVGKGVVTISKKHLTFEFENASVSMDIEKWADDRIEASLNDVYMKEV